MPMPTSAQVCDFDRSISKIPVNIRVGGFHLEDFFRTLVHRKHVVILVCPNLK